MRCPRCDGNLIRDDDGLTCLQCGWGGYPTAEAVALRERLLETPSRRGPRHPVIKTQGVRLD